MMVKGSHQRERMPIWRDAQRLLLEVEQAVKLFPRYHKYTLGTDLRRQAMEICRCLSRAVSANGQARLSRVERLVEQVDDMKITIQLARELKVFNSFATFSRIAEQVVSIGKQGGAWLRHLRQRSAGPEPVASS
ncbi:four helix bundle protein [Thiolapillus sp.]